MSTPPPESRDHDQSCPICLVDKAPLAQSGSCGHSFCTDCLRQFFALPSSTSQEDPSANEAPSYVLPVKILHDCNIDGIATLKGCPLCRCPMSLLELKHAASSEPVWASSCQTQFQNSPLSGKTYATRRGIGYNSFHFPPFSNPEDGDNMEEEQEHNNLPYFLWEEDDAMVASANDTEEEQEVDPSQATKYYFQPGCFYFAPKRSFHGQLLLPDAHGTPQPHDVLLDFAANHRWITGGLLFRRPSQERPASAHPLEGRWKVTWYKEHLPLEANLEGQPEDKIIDTAHINVVDNSVLDAQSLVYRLRYEPDHVSFQWPGFGVTQTLEAESDFRKSGIPAVGDYLRWTTTDADQPFIVWQRETIVDPNASIKPSITYFGRSGDRNSGNNHDPFSPRNTSQTWYREWRPNNDTTNSTQPGRPPYYKDRLWGNSFCQGLRVGLASYHFGMQAGEEEGSEGAPFAYISYENDMCSQWPPLDDGSPIPPQVHFHGISLERAEPANDNPAEEDTDAAHYVFRGNIEWLRDYGTTWQNNERWEYEIHFDSEFTCIVSGTVHCVTASNNDSRQEMSQFGTELVYVNAGIVNAFEAWMNDDNLLNEPPPGEPDEVYPRYTHISRGLRRRLQAEGASVRTVAMLNMIFTHSLQPGNDSPIDYNT